QYGIKRDGASYVAKGYDDEQSIYTPAWQEAITSVKPELVTQIAREFAQNAIDTGGKSMIIMGAGINHWFNSDTIYRSILNLVILTGSQGNNGGGWHTTSVRRKFVQLKDGIILLSLVIGKVHQDYKTQLHSFILERTSGSTKRREWTHCVHQ